MATTRISPLAAQIEMIGVDKVKTALREVSSDAEHMSNRLADHYGKAARHLSLVTNEAVRAGEIGGSALQKILTVGGDMVGMFGATGAVVGALSVAGLAIYNVFDRARKQIEETARAARAELRSLRDESAQSAALHLNRVAGGDIYADKEIERKSVAELEAERTRLQAAKVDVYTPGGTVRATSQENVDRIKEINAELERRNRILEEGVPLLQATATAEGKTVIAEGKKGLAAQSERDANEAFKRKLDNLKELGKGTQDFFGAFAESISKTIAQEPAKQAGRFDLAAVVGDPKQLADDYAKNHPFDWNAYFEQLIAAGNAGGLLPKINSPLQQMGEQIRSSISHTLGSAIYDGFAAAFSGKGLGGIFKSFGKTLLAGLGQIISEQGMIYLEYSGIMQAFTPLLGNPFTAGFAGAAIGAALIALGAALGAAASGGGHSHASASVPRPAEITNVKLTATSVADQARYDPRATIHQTIIGPGDPVAFRQIQQGLDNNKRRT